jgi:hypothetical protein
MIYQSLEKEFKRIYTDFALENWIIDCGKDVFSKIIAFNFFSELYYANLNGANLRECIEEIEKHLRATDRGIDPIDRIRESVKAGFPHFWDSPISLMDRVRSFSRIIPFERIEEVYYQISGKPYSRITGGVTLVYVNETIDKIVDNMIKLTKSTHLFTGKNGIVWLASTDEIQVFLDSMSLSFPCSTEVRDLLGLYFRNLFLIEVQFKPDSNFFSYRIWTTLEINT